MHLADIGLLKSEEIQLLTGSLQPLFALELTPVSVSIEHSTRNWSRGLSPAVTPVGPSEFENLVATLRLTPEQYEGSAALKAWVRKNKNTKYVPTELLRVWRFEV